MLGSVKGMEEPLRGRAGYWGGCIFRQMG